MGINAIKRVLIDYYLKLILQIFFCETFSNNIVFSFTNTSKFKLKIFTYVIFICLWSKIKKKKNGEE